MFVIVFTYVKMEQRYNGTAAQPSSKQEITQDVKLR